MEGGGSKEVVGVTRPSSHATSSEGFTVTGATRLGIEIHYIESMVKRSLPLGSATEPRATLPPRANQITWAESFAWSGLARQHCRCLSPQPRGNSPGRAEPGKERPEASSTLGRQINSRQIPNRERLHFQSSRLVIFRLLLYTQGVPHGQIHIQIYIITIPQLLDQ